MKKYNKISIVFSLASIFISILDNLLNNGLLTFISIGLFLTGLFIFIVGLLLELNRGGDK